MGFQIAGRDVFRKGGKIVLGEGKVEQGASSLNIPGHEKKKEKEIWGGGGWGGVIIYSMKVKVYAT